MQGALQGAYSRLLEREKIDVILTGEAGDVIFGFGEHRPAHLADPLLRGNLAAAIREARRWQAHAGGQRPWTHFFLHNSLRPAWQHLRRRSILTAASDPPPAWLHTSMLERFRDDPAHGRWIGPPMHSASAQYLWDSVYQMASITNSSFRDSLNADTRHPLFYRPLVEFLLSLPPDLRHGPDGDRVLQREALADRLPASVAARSTKGSAQPSREFSLLQNAAWLRCLTVDTRLEARGWVDPPQWREQVARAQFGVFNGLASFDAAMSTEVWLRATETLAPPDPPDLLDSAADDSIIRGGHFASRIRRPQQGQRSG
jgi:hypothetical protein